ncbi:uncharacterized protein LOC111081041 isoform X3 [Drosophila obscura]|uniref:uncharacterized protein LOC111081041 isoform X3 n=1 Tax=Drosophila obscura TaxID=7282 RepID=UPI001BB28D5E|nr:uncharacterized protein LOC111081041 isoform X3 [Drosophila obscura]
MQDRAVVKLEAYSAQLCLNCMPLPPPNPTLPLFTTATVGSSSLHVCASLVVNFGWLARAVHISEIASELTTSNS